MYLESQSAVGLLIGCAYMIVPVVGALSFPMSETARAHRFVSQPPTLDRDTHTKQSIQICPLEQSCGGDGIYIYLRYIVILCMTYSVD